MERSQSGPYAGQRAYYGDIHNHCAVSYGHGTIEEAYANARLQLDFASVTGHAEWHDMPRDEERLKEVVAYHELGFETLQRNWEHFLDVTEHANDEGQFVTFPSFEWHSMRYGDHCVYLHGPERRIVQAADIEGLREALRTLAARGTRAYMVPHHIGYQPGWRGINWDVFTPELTPFVEILSMHGCAESDEAPRPFLHSMGPRDGRSTMQEGLRRGYVFGVVGSTDHHSGHPGSHGYGRMALWAPELTREALWEAMGARRVYALTGDRIELAVTLNDRPMGAVLPSTDEREISIEVVGGGPIDYVELVRNGEPVHRLSAHEMSQDQEHGFHGLVTLAVGWGRRMNTNDWVVDLGIEGGTVRGIEPRFRGEDAVAPQSQSLESYQYTQWERLGTNRVRFRTHTHGAPTVVTDATQSIALEVRGDDETRVVAEINGQEVAHTIGELRTGARTGYLGGYLSGAYRFGRATPRREYAWRTHFIDRRPAGAVDAYYVRVRQLNDQWAWSSPIWVGHSR